MKLEIDRIAYSEFDFDTYFNEYIVPKKPVIVEGVFTFDSDKVTPEYVKENFSNESKKELGWFDSDLVDNEIIAIPDFVKKILAREEYAVRKSPMRVFMQPQGHITLPHYDGNSLHGLNQQVIGEKRWILTSPKTPLPCMPFMYAGLVGRDFVYAPEKYDFYDFISKPGDVVSIPPYWFHEVHSLGKVNCNANWVFTPKKPDESTGLGKREVEIVKLRKTWPFVNKAFFPDEFSNYGGQGEELIKTYSENVGMTRMVGRFVKELAAFPKTILMAKQLRSRADEFKKNNFNV
ncbi:cupin-like domain-containing protein [Aliiglaciecola litoralis]|uniref:JmjC domain-containing protein n=1 Tax=Aliiglaciecola litoralis TaxID=582857 RepID=A0ABN1LFB8_9ALTE